MQKIYSVLLEIYIVGKKKDFNINMDDEIINKSILKGEM